MDTEHDVIVIGMGVGGEEVAGGAAEGGLDVLAIERKLIGGECPYWGCIPSKVMVRAADSLAEAARVARLAGDARVFPKWEPVARRVRDATADWDDAIAVERHEAKGEKLARGHARITGPRDVEVDERRHRARRGIVVAAGSSPAIPAIEGLSEVSYWTNREAIEATEVPRSLVVLGAGAVGLELAQVFRRFGSEVTVVEQTAGPLPAEEPENREALARVLKEEGIELVTGVTATSVFEAGGSVFVALDDGRELMRERLLIATGRRANIGGLGVENVGLDPSQAAIEVDADMRAGDGVWAVGDVTGKGQFTHVAVYQGRIAAADLLGQKHPPADYSAVPRVTFTDPEVTSVGLTEKQAREAGIDLLVGISETASSARGWIHGPGATHGVMKLVADRARGVIVGASTMGPAAGEIVTFLALAIKQRIPVPSLRQLIYPYPTFIRGLEDTLSELDQ